MSKFCPSPFSSFFFQVGNEIRPGEKENFWLPSSSFFLFFPPDLFRQQSPKKKEEEDRRKFSLVFSEDAQMYSYHKPKKEQKKTKRNFRLFVNFSKVKFRVASLFLYKTYSAFLLYKHQYFWSNNFFCRFADVHKCSHIICQT